MAEKKEIKDSPRVEIQGRKATVFQYGASGGVMIPEEVMEEHGIVVGGTVRWITLVTPEGNFLCLRTVAE